MRVLFLGTGGYHPNERRHTACVLLPELGLMLDAGTGAFRVTKHIATERLDVVVTHAHLDHVVGLTYLLGLQHAGKDVRVVVHGAGQTIDAVKHSLLDERLFPIQPCESFESLGDELRTPSGAELTTFPLEHPGGSLGLRIEHNGKSLAYVTDTTELTDASIARIQGVDLLIHEAYFTEADRDFAQQTGHSTAAQAAKAAAKSGAKRLILVHRDPRAESDQEALREAKEVFLDSSFADDELACDL